MRFCGRIGNDRGKHGCPPVNGSCWFKAAFDTQAGIAVDKAPGDERDIVDRISCGNRCDNGAQAAKGSVSRCLCRRIVAEVDMFAPEHQPEQGRMGHTKAEITGSTGRQTLERALGCIGLHSRGHVGKSDANEFGKQGFFGREVIIGGLSREAGPLRRLPQGQGKHTVPFQKIAR